MSAPKVQDPILLTTKVIGQAFVGSTQEVPYGGIGDIVCTPSSAMPGQSVLVEVHAKDGTAYDNNESFYIGINGIPGSRQYLQFSAPGPQTIQVTALGPNGFEHSTATVQVQQSPPPPNPLPPQPLATGVSPVPISLVPAYLWADVGIPLLRVDRIPTSRYAVAFGISQEPAIAGTVGTVKDNIIARHVAVPVPPTTTTTTTTTTTPILRIGSVENVAAIGAVPPAPSAPSAPSPPPAATQGSVVRDEVAVPSAAITASSASLTGTASVATTPAGAPKQSVGTIPIVSKINMLPPILVTTRSPPVEGKYVWDFGDGTREVGTDTPYVEHDYEHSIDHLREYQQFDVTVTSEGKSVTRTITISSAYAQVKKYTGVLNPPIYSDDYALKFGNGFAGTMVITNYESVPITLTSRSVVPIFSDGSRAATSGPVESLPSPITVGGGSSLSVQVFVPFSLVPDDSMGFIAYYSGTSSGGGGTPVRTGAFFDISPQDRTTSGIRLGNIALTHVAANDLSRVLSSTAVVSPSPVHVGTGAASTTVATTTTAASTAVAAAAPALAPANAVRPPVQLESKVAAESSAPSEIRAIPPGVAATTTATATTTVTTTLETTHLLGPSQLTDTAVNLQNIFANVQGDTTPTPQTPNVGDICDPDNLPDNIPEDYVCQATNVQQYVPTPGRFMNARKGDLALEPGGSNGLIGALLQQVTPPQRYSHCGMMTLNHVQITHCTMSEQRMQDYPVGTDPTTGKPAPIHGFRTDVVKYGWPGVITQAVQDAVGGQLLTDPDNKKQYRLGFDVAPAEADLSGNWVVVQPLIIKPDPMLETPAVRQQMHTIADDAAAQAGKAHYRLYCYTDPTIGQTTVAPSDAGWATGTFPAVCSSFIWMMAKKNGVHLQGMGATTQQTDLSQLEQAAGAMVGPSTPDGLYLYTASERLTAANFLYNAIYTQAYAQTGWIGEFLTKAADHIANEILNTFGSDTTQTDDDNNTWQQTQDANAVSPDNMMFWRSPPTSVYGYTEPLIYREPRYDTVTVYRWNKVITHGALSGTVNYNGSPMGGVTVQLYDGMTAFTDGNGNYQLQNVPYGQYTVQAQLVQQDGTYLSASLPVDIESPNVTLNIDLQLPPDMYRTVHIQGNIHTRYTHWDAFVKTDDESADLPFFLAMDVGPFGTHAEQSVVHDVPAGTSDDAHVVLHFVVDWNLDKSVNVAFTLSLHDQNPGSSFNLPEGAWQSWSGLYATADNDHSEASFTATNDLKQG